MATTTTIIIYMDTKTGKSDIYRINCKTNDKC